MLSGGTVFILSLPAQEGRFAPLLLMSYATAGEAST